MFPTSAVFRAGLAAFTKLFADQYAADNVRMNNVLPGWIDSLPAKEERRDACRWGATGRRGDRRDDRVPGFGRGGVHHRAEPAGRRRADAKRLRGREPVADASSCPVYVARRLSASVVVAVWSTRQRCPRPCASKRVTPRGHRVPPRAGGNRRCGGTPEERDRAVRVLVQPHARPREVRPERALGNMQAAALPAHGVVVADLAGLLEAEHLAPLRRRHGDEGAALLLCRHGEAGVVRRQIERAQPGVGCVDLADPGERQLLGQPALQGAEGALRLAAAPAASRRRYARWRARASARPTWVGCSRSTRRRPPGCGSSGLPRSV